MRVLQICGYFPPFVLGGDAIAAYSYMLALNDVGIKNDTLLWPIRMPEKINIIPEVNKERGNFIYKINLNRFNYSFSRFFNYNFLVEKDIGRFLEENCYKFDIVNLHLPGVFGSHIFTYLKKMDIKTIVTLHDYWIVCPKATLIDYRRSQCPGNLNSIKCLRCLVLSHKPPAIKIWYPDLLNVDAFICPSNYLKNLHTSFFPLIRDRFHHIPNAVKFEDKQARLYDSSNRLQNKFTVLYVGRLEWVKGVVDLIQAFKILPDEYHLIIAGTGSIKTQLEKIVLRSSLKNKISFLGQISKNEVNLLYKFCNIVCLPSIWKENNSMVLIEALSHMKPCITTNQGGNPEIIIGGKTGFIVNINSPIEIANRIIELRNNKQLYKEMQNQCFHRYERYYSIKSLGVRLNCLFKKILDENTYNND